MALHSRFERILRNRCCCAVYYQQYRRKRWSSKPRVGNSYSLGSKATYENQYMIRDKVVTKLWKIPYPEQLKLKQSYAEKAMVTCYNRLKNEVLKGKDHPVLAACDQNENRLFPVEEIRTTNECYHYRNKSEYTIDRGLDGKPKVGHIIGKMPGAICVKTDLCLNLKKEHLATAQLLQQFIEQSQYSFLDPHEMKPCNWLSLLLRSTYLGDYMAVVRIYSANKSQEFLEGAQEELNDFFETGPAKDQGVTSLHIHHLNSINLWDPNKTKYKLVSGEPFIVEKVLDCYFKMCPGDFFQVYTKGAEIVYSTVKELLNVNHNTTVLDLCCGIGAIGILLAREAKKVIGIEIMESALENARRNAEYNDIKNMQFVCEKVHRVLKDLNKYVHVGEDDTDIVAVVNPGRAGVKQDVINSLRQNNAIKRVVYVSCKPYGNAAMNLVQMVSPQSEKNPGEPFRPVKAVPVDLFPLTIHYELLLLFER